MEEEIKNPKNPVEYTVWKQWKPIVSVLRKIQVSEELSKIDNAGIKLYCL